MAQSNNSETTDSKRPDHVAIIMDGNGRWAKSKGMIRIAGHREGAKTVDKIVTACRKLNIKALTLYAFSAQNWERPSLEVTALMELLSEYLKTEKKKILKNNIRLTAIGEIEKLPAKTRKALRDVIEASSRNSGMILSLALSYGGREEILDAAKSICAQVKNGTVNPGDINEELFTENTWSKESGPVDLIIRTSGEQRISNFMLWSAPYAELYFSKKMWPDFNEKDLEEAFNAFALRQRKYGKLK
jgi:undecaprenyl diphosphate synthase